MTDSNILFLLMERVKGLPDYPVWAEVSAKSSYGDAGQKAEFYGEFADVLIARMEEVFRQADVRYYTQRPAAGHFPHTCTWMVDLPNPIVRAIGRNSNLTAVCTVDGSSDRGGKAFCEISWTALERDRGTWCWEGYGGEIDFLSDLYPLGNLGSYDSFLIESSKWKDLADQLTNYFAYCQG